MSLQLVCQEKLKVHWVQLSKIQTQKESNDMFVHCTDNQAASWFEAEMKKKRTR